MNLAVRHDVADRIDFSAPSMTLTWPEMYLAAAVANMRCLGNMRRALRARFGAPDDAWELHFFSCQGEMATAKYLNLFWAGTVGDYGAVDVGGEHGIEVRTARKNHHKLILHPDDKEDRPFVLVSAEDAPTFRLIGWFYGRDGKDKRFWDDPVGGRPAYFVPQSELRALAELKDIIGGLPYLERCEQ